MWPPPGRVATFPLAQQLNPPVPHTQAGRTYILAARTAAERDRWVAGLQEAARSRSRMARLQSALLGHAIRRSESV